MQTARERRETPYSVILDPSPRGDFVVQTAPTQRAILIRQRWHGRLSLLHSLKMPGVLHVVMLIEVLVVDVLGEGSVDDKGILGFGDRAEPGQIHGVELESRGRGRGLAGDRGGR